MSEKRSAGTFTIEGEVQGGPYPADEPERMLDEQYFVYVDAGLHLWRWVLTVRASSGDAAIHKAQAEAIEMGNEPANCYMAAPFSALTTWGEADIARAD